MDGFRNKFIKLVNGIKDGDVLSTELDNYVKENSTKTIFKDAIKSLMDESLPLVKVYAARYSFEYNIDKKKSYYISRYILRREKDISCRIEAKYIYDRYNRRFISRITKLIHRKVK